MSNNEKPPSNTSNGANTNPDPSNPSNSTASTNTSTNASNTTSNNNSITSRIQSSASNLARSALSSTPADVTSSLPGASKPGSSRPGAGQAYYTETAPAPGSSLGSGSRAGTGTGAGTGVESFRSTGSSGHEGDIEDVYSYEFPGAEAGAGAEASAGAWIEEERSGIETGKGKGKGREIFEQVWTSTQRQYAQHGQNQAQQQGGHQENAADGADVLTLLASPSFNPDFPDDEQDQIPNDLSDYQAQDTGLSAEEIQMLDSFRRPSQNQGQSQSHSQDRGANKITQNSLIPDIDTFLSSLPAQTPTSETELRDAVLTGLSGAEDWVAVEDRYQDEVWGFLKPVLQAAAAEMEESRQYGEDQGTGHGQDGPAVARLKMILMHMRA